MSGNGAYAMAMMQSSYLYDCDNCIAAILIAKAPFQPCTGCVMAGGMYFTTARDIATTDAPLIGAQRKSNPACILLKDVYDHLHESTEPKRRKRGRPRKLKRQINTSHPKRLKPKPRSRPERETDITELFKEYDLYDIDSDIEEEIVSTPEDTIDVAITETSQTNARVQSDNREHEDSDTAGQRTIEADQLERDIMAELLVSHRSPAARDPLDNADAGAEECADSLHSEPDSVEEENGVYPVKSDVTFAYDKFLKECESVILRHDEQHYGVELGWPVQRIEAVLLGSQPQFLIRYKRNNFGWIAVEWVPLSVLVNHCSQRIIQDFQAITQNIDMQEQSLNPDTGDYLIL